MSAFIASYFGECSDCWDSIQPGQEVVYNVRDDLVHVDCPVHPATKADAAALAKPRCPVCGLNHPGEC